jgi:hypothetical protein
MRIASLAVATMLSLAVSSTSFALQLKPNELPANLPGTTYFAALPEGFDALSASDEVLANYGLPPRPDADANPKAYASWAKAIGASKIRIVPTLVQTNRYHGPAKAGESKVDNVGTGTSYNWSGFLNLSGATNRGSTSFYYIISDFVTPVARQAFGACTGGWDYGSSWVGIDGWNSPDVLQAGIGYDAYCSGSTTSTYYNVWYEWYPAGSVGINLPIAPGDDFFVEVWSTSTTQGYAYVVNESTDQYVDIGFTAPSGTALEGNSAEWIVERPTVNGAYATLTNYVDDVFWDANAYTFAGVNYQPSSASSYAITGLDNSGNAESAPTLLGASAFLMSTEGSAY